MPLPPRRTQCIVHNKHELKRTLGKTNTLLAYLNNKNYNFERIRSKRPGPELITFPGFFSHPSKFRVSEIPPILMGVINNNFSRGTVHAASNDPLADPEIDPHYFEQDMDRQMFIELVHYIRRIARTVPLCNFINASETAELNPGAEFATDEQIASWIPQGSGTINHTAGSLAMLPREKNGVVDSNLKVYGIKNIRVVDLSIAPVHSTAHSQATVYAIAEQGE
uniref:Glucose-methanol-choline oxidoreductase C-terminal domain-containing protein n=1 Tax=Moniliophthora roreri TaxID=221103 RepID=A0A0W0EZU7_MONRR